MERMHWMTHLQDHHRSTSVGRGVDPSFARVGIRWDAHGREVGGLLLLLVLHAPAAVVAPLFYLTLVVHAVRYVAIHTRAHRDPEWCRTHLPWRPTARRAA